MNKNLALSVKIRQSVITKISIADKKTMSRPRILYTKFYIPAMLAVLPVSLLNNKKPAILADFSDLTLVRESDLSSWSYYSKSDYFVNPSTSPIRPRAHGREVGVDPELVEWVKTLIKTLEMRGVEPLRSGMISPISHLGTPRAILL